MEAPSDKGCCILDPETILVVSFEDIKTPVLQTWRFSGSLDGTLCAAYALPEDGVSAEIHGEQTSSSKSLPMNLPQSVFRPSGRHQMIAVHCLSDFRDSSLQIFVPISVFQQDYNYEPSDPIPYLEWSSRSLTSTYDYIPNQSFYAGRCVGHPTPGHIDVFEFVTHRCRASESKPTSPAVGEFVGSQEQNGGGIDELQSFSLPYWCMSRDWRMLSKPDIPDIRLPMGVDSESYTFVDNEHIVYIDVSDRTSALDAEMMLNGNILM